MQTLAGEPSLGDGGPAASALLRYPQALAFDPRGNLYIADTGNVRIRKVSTNGTITTVAGNGTLGDSGDGGAALAAQLSSDIPGLAAAVDGTFYIADNGNHRVRKVTPDGRITTVAGDLDMELGKLCLDDEGNLYIGDRGNGRALKLDPQGNLSTLAQMERPLAPRRPGSAAVDRNGNKYVLDRQRRQVLKIAPDGLETVIAGAENSNQVYYGDGGPAIEAQLADPREIAVAPNGDLYISDYDFAVRVVTADGKIHVAAGRPHFTGDGGPAKQALFTRPYGLTLDAAGNIYVADMENRRVRKIDRRWTISTVAGNGEITTDEAAIGPLMGRVLALSISRASFLSPTTTAFAGYCHRGSCCPLWARAKNLSAAMAARVPKLESIIPWDWQSIPQATCLSRIPITTASGKWLPMVSSPPSRAWERKDSVATTTRPGVETE